MNYTKFNNPEMLNAAVTAVKLFEDYILAGIGSNLCVYNIFCIDVCSDRIKVLKGQKIYGIVPSKCGKKILIYGGKQYTILSVEDGKHFEKRKTFSKVFETIVCDDWFLSGIWFENEVVALLTAHNVVQKWNITTQKLLETHPSKDCSLLYSGYLLLLEETILVLAGTANGQVIIYNIQNEEPLHKLLGHKGVVLSISCHPEKHLLVTSDDQSIRLWGPKTQPKHATNSKDYWISISIECKHILHEHNAKVLRSHITHSTVISVGEDSAICHWSFMGELLKKSVTHKNGSVLCVDANDKYVLTGEDNGAIVYQPLITSTDYCETETIKFNIGAPKKVKFTLKRNLLVLNETDLVLYDVPNMKLTSYKLTVTGYNILELSGNHQLIAVADMNGKLDIFVERGEKEAFLINIIDTKLCIGKILSMHWAGNFLVFCSDNGLINIFLFMRQYKNMHVHMKVHAKYILPPCKERWLTAVSIFCNNDLFACGDRSGNVHMYKKSNNYPIKSFCGVHGDYGPTIIQINTRSILTAGKDGKINYFICNYEGTTFSYTSQRHIEFKWLAFFFDSYEEMICGFQGRKFVLYDLKHRSKYFEISCGGGHRSWDVIKYWEKLGEAVEFVYLQNKNIVKVTIHLGKFAPVYAKEGFHTKAINCLKTYKSNNYKTMFYVSVGQDTTLRISDTCHVYDFRQRAILNHKSNMITLKVFNLSVDDVLLVCAGARGKLCIRRIDFNKYSSFPAVTARDLVDYTIKESHKERDKSLRDYDPGIRIMDVDLIKTGDHFLVFAGCSDAVLRLFKFKYNVPIIEPDTWLIDHGKGEFKLLKELKYHKTCIIKTSCMIISNRDILVTCATNGDVAFWDILESSVSEPFLKINNYKSGIHSLNHCSISDKQFLIATGGDGNAIHLDLLEILNLNNLASIKVVQQWSSSQFHSAQISGLCFVNQYLLSVSIDQRVTLFQWKVDGEGIRCDFLSQHLTDITDIHGLDLVESLSDSITICVFGKGMEVLCIPVK